jgi:anthranilate phosphoribosyltransferase
MNTEFPNPWTHSTLPHEEMAHSLKLLLRKDILEEAKGRFLSALHQRGETAAELAGFATLLLEEAVSPDIIRSPEIPLLELCGTGGDQAGLLNISTAAMFVVAGVGVSVVKHGRRAVSSRCGSADVLEALGVTLHLRPERINEVLEQANCVFLLATDFHPAVAAVAPLRRALAAGGQLTMFNLLGPLLNPARPDVQLTGVYAPELLDLYASALGLIGRRTAWAVHGEGGAGEGGFDELSITGPSRVASYVAGREESVEHFVIHPQELGFSQQVEMASLQGGNALENAARIVAILSGNERSAARSMIVLNAAAALHIAGKAKTLAEGIIKAEESLDSGRALRSLETLRQASQKASSHGTVS